MNNRPYTTNELLAMDHDDLIIYLDSVCDIKMPENAETAEDLKNISDFLAKAASLYTYVANLELMARIKKKKLKGEKADKAMVDAALMTEEIFHSYAENLKFMYNAASRIVTIRTNILEELRMLKDSI